MSNTGVKTSGLNTTIPEALPFESVKNESILRDLVSEISKKDASAPTKFLQVIESAFYSASDEEPIQMEKFAAILENQLSLFFSNLGIVRTGVEILQIVQKINFVLDKDGITPFANSFQERPREGVNYRILTKALADELSISLNAAEAMSVGTEGQEIVRNILSYRRNVDQFFQDQISNKGSKLQFFARVKEALNTETGPIMLEFTSNEEKIKNEAEAIAFIMRYLDTSKFEFVVRYEGNKLKLAIMGRDAPNKLEGFQPFEVFDKVFGKGAQDMMTKFNELYETPEKKWAGGILAKAKQRFETVGKVGIAAARIAGSFAVNYIPAISFITSAKSEMSKYGEYDSTLSITDKSFTWGSFTLKTWDSEAGMKVFKNIDLGGKEHKVSPQVYLLRQVAIRESKLTTDPRIDDFVTDLFEFENVKGINVEANFVNGLSKILADKDIYNSFINEMGNGRRDVPSYNDLFTQFEQDGDDAAIGLNSRNIHTLIQILNESASSKSVTISNYFGNTFLVALQKTSLKEGVSYLQIDSQMTKRRSILGNVTDRIRGMNVSRSIEAAIAGGRTAGMGAGMTGTSAGFAIDAMLAVPSTIQTVQRRVERRVLQKIDSSANIKNGELDQMIKSIVSESLVEVSVGFASYALVSIPLRALGVKLNAENGGSWLEQKLSTNVVDYLARVFAALVVVKRKVSQSQANEQINKIFAEETGRSGSLLGTLNTFNRIMKEFPDVYASFMLAINGASMGSGLNTLAGAMSKGEDVIHKVAQGYDSITQSFQPQASEAMINNVTLASGQPAIEQVTGEPVPQTNTLNPAIQNEFNSVAVETLRILENAASQINNNSEINIEILPTGNILFEDKNITLSGFVQNAILSETIRFKVGQNNIEILKMGNENIVRVGGFGITPVQVNPNTIDNEIKLEIAKRVAGLQNITQENVIHGDISTQDLERMESTNLKSAENDTLEYTGDDRTRITIEDGLNNPYVQDTTLGVSPGAGSEQFKVTETIKEVSILGSGKPEGMRLIEYSNKSGTLNTYYIRSLENGRFTYQGGQGYITAFDNTGIPRGVFKLDSTGNPMAFAPIDDMAFSPGEKRLDFNNDGVPDLIVKYSANGRVDPDATRFPVPGLDTPQPLSPGLPGTSGDSNKEIKFTDLPEFKVSDTNEVRGVLGFDDGTFKVARDWTGAIVVTQGDAVINFDNGAGGTTSSVGLDAFDKGNGTRYDFVQLKSGNEIYTFNRNNGNVRLQSIHQIVGTDTIQPLWGKVPTEINDNIRSTTEFSGYTRTDTPDRTIGEAISLGKADQSELKPIGDLLTLSNGVMGGARKGITLMPISIIDANGASSQYYILNNADKRWFSIDGKKFMSVYTEKGELAGITDGYRGYGAQGDLANPNGEVTIEGNNLNKKLKIKYNGGYVATVEDITNPNELKTLWTNPNRNIVNGNLTENLSTTVPSLEVRPAIVEGIKTVNVGTEQVVVRGTDFTFDGSESRYVTVTDATGKEIKGFLIHNQDGTYSPVPLNFSDGQIPTLNDLPNENSVVRRNGDDGNIYFFVRDQGAVRVDAIVKVNNDRTWTPVFRRLESVRDLSDSEITARLGLQTGVVPAPGPAQGVIVPENLSTDIPRLNDNNLYIQGSEIDTSREIISITDYITVSNGKYSRVDISNFGKLNFLLDGDIPKAIDDNKIAILSNSNHKYDSILQARGGSWATTAIVGENQIGIILDETKIPSELAPKLLSEEIVQGLLLSKQIENAKLQGTNLADLGQDMTTGNTRAAVEIVQAYILGDDNYISNDNYYDYMIQGDSTWTVSDENDAQFLGLMERAASKIDTIMSNAVSDYSSDFINYTLTPDDLAKLYLNGSVMVNGKQLSFNQIDKEFNRLTGLHMNDVFGLRVNGTPPISIQPAPEIKIVATSKTLPEPFTPPEATPVPSSTPEAVITEESMMREVSSKDSLPFAIDYLKVKLQSGTGQEKVIANSLLESGIQTKSIDTVNNNEYVLNINFKPGTDITDGISASEVNKVVLDGADYEIINSSKTNDTNLILKGAVNNGIHPIFQIDTETGLLFGQSGYPAENGDMLLVNSTGNPGQLIDNSGNNKPILTLIDGANLSSEYGNQSVSILRSNSDSVFYVYTMGNPIETYPSTALGGTEYIRIKGKDYMLGNASYRLVTADLNSADGTIGWNEQEQRYELMPSTPPTEITSTTEPTNTPTPPVSQWEVIPMEGSQISGLSANVKASMETGGAAFAFPGGTGALAFSSDKNNLMIYIFDIEIGNTVSPTEYQFKYLEGDKLVGMYKGKIYVIDLVGTPSVYDSATEFNNDPNYNKIMVVNSADNGFEMEEKVIGTPTQAAPTDLPSNTPTVTSTLTPEAIQLNQKIIAMNEDAWNNLSVRAKGFLPDYSPFGFENDISGDLLYDTNNNLVIKLQTSSGNPIPSSEYDFEYLGEDKFVGVYNGKVYVFSASDSNVREVYDSVQAFDAESKYSKRVVVDGAGAISLADKVSTGATVTQASATATSDQGQSSGSTETLAPQLTPTPTDTPATNPLESGVGVSSFDTVGGNDGTTIGELKNSFTASGLTYNTSGNIILFPPRTISNDLQIGGVGFRSSADNDIVNTNNVESIAIKYQGGDYTLRGLSNGKGDLNFTFLKNDGSTVLVQMDKDMNVYVVEDNSDLAKLVGIVGIGGIVGIAGMRKFKPIQKSSARRYIRNYPGIDDVLENISTMDDKDIRQFATEIYSRDRSRFDKLKWGQGEIMGILKSSKRRGSQSTLTSTQRADLDFLNG